MENTVLLEKQEDNFTRFPEIMQKFFLERNFTIDIYPNDISAEQETGATAFEVTSAEQYYDYLSAEIDFWIENDPEKKLEPIVRYSRFQSARKYFDNALSYVSSPNSMESNLFQSISNMSGGALSFKTNLAQELLKYKDKTKSFFDGFKAGMLNDNVSFSVSVTPDSLRGFYYAMAYRNILDKYSAFAEESISEFKTKAEEATRNYSSLNENYTRSFLEQEKRLDSLTEQTNSHLIELDEKSVRQFEEANSRLDDMEKLYREKLRLEEPARYWETLDTDYKKKGTKWLIISGILALAIVAGLITILLLAPEVFSDENHWFDNLKNSAIITVVASVAIYMLRLTVKMGTSSYHLSRDAKERNNLSYFYLALIEKGAVSDKERALILNALFSRSDTGLLKGDAAPSMPTNVSDIIEILKANKS